MSSKEKKPDIVQVKNPKSGHYVKIDRSKGKIIDHKKSDGPYKGVPIASKRKGFEGWAKNSVETLLSNF
jgi:hypothetical protein